MKNINLPPILATVLRSHGWVSLVGLSKELQDSVVNKLFEVPHIYRKLNKVTSQDTCY